jgi:DNA-binding response OmpR family regulator
LARLLVVEDNTDLAALLGKGLGKAGFSADIVSTAFDANHVLATNHYVLILLDLGLPASATGTYPVRPLWP